MHHLPHSHLEVHLREFEQPEAQISTSLAQISDQSAYLLKKRGIRTSDLRRSGPKLPPYWRGVAIRGLLMGGLELRIAETGNMRQ
jgi:hypothetical protein